MEKIKHQVKCTEEQRLIALVYIVTIIIYYMMYIQIYPTPHYRVRTQVRVKTKPVYVCVVGQNSLPFQGVTEVSIEE